MGASGARRSPVMEAPFLREGTTIRVLSDAPSRFFFSSGRCINKALSMYPSAKNYGKNDDLDFKRVLQCFVFLIDVPSGKNGRKFPISVPSVRFPLFTYPLGRFF